MDMKTKILITLFSTVFSLQILNAQTSYMPVFEDTTRYYYAFQGFDFDDFGYIELKKTSDSTFIPIIDPIAINFYKYLIINNTNSKIWGVLKDDDTKILLMNLDMNVGEQYMDGAGCSHIVDSVYWKDGRKHIRFEKHQVNLGPVLNSYFEFIEGVGTNTCFMFYVCDRISEISWLRSQYKNRILSYGVPEWYPYWDYIGMHVGLINIEEVNRIQLYPSPVRNILSLEFSDSFNLNNTKLNIYDIRGKHIFSYFPTDRKITLDVCYFLPGIYLLNISNNENNKTFKFIKS